MRFCSPYSSMSLPIFDSNHDTMEKICATYAEGFNFELSLVRCDDSVVKTPSVWNGMVGLRVHLSNKMPIQETFFLKVKCIYLP